MPFRAAIRNALLAAALLLPVAARAEPVSLPDTEVVHLVSKVNGVDYKLFVGAPPGHAAGSGEIQAVLLLDADYSFPIAQAVATHLRERRDLPDLLIVSIGYGGPRVYKLNRTRDYTPTHAPAEAGAYGQEYQAHSGGGPKFLAFIESELMPLLHKRYRAAPKPVLVGHSFGGLFTTWVALSRPDLLAGAIIVSPSLWYDGSWVLGLEAGLGSALRAVPRKIYAAVGAHEGNSDHDMVRQLLDLERRLSDARYGATKARVEALDDETHNSVFPRALGNGLRFLWPRGSFPISKAPGTR